MLYPLLRAVAWVAVRWYYRRIDTEGRERVPARGPVILAANHNNALVDALLVATSLKREVRLTAKATLLDHPLTRVLVHAVGVVPLRRAADDARATGHAPDATRNQTAFQAIVETLAAQRMVLIFPEGISHSQPELAPLRTGCARMALQAAREGVKGVQVVPVGLTFEAKGLPRSRVALRFGTPIPVAADDLSHPEAVATLTARIDHGLRAVTLNFPSRDDAARVFELSETLARTIADVGSLSDPLPPLTNTVRMAQRVDAVRQRLPELPETAARRVTAFLEDVERWQHEARRYASPRDVGMSLSHGAGIWFAARELAIAVVAAPLALWGRLNHWLPLRVALAVSRATSRNPDEPAMHALVAGLGLVLATYAVTAVLITQGFGWPWAAAYLVSLPPAASMDFWWSERATSALRRARGFLALRAAPDVAAQLSGERERLRSEAAELARLLT